MQVRSNESCKIGYLYLSHHLKKKNIDREMNPFPLYSRTKETLEETPNKINNRMLSNIFVINIATMSHFDLKLL